MRALKPSQLEQYRRLTTCLVASAIETFRVRLPNSGFADSSIRCMFPDQPAMAGQEQHTARSAVRCQSRV